MERYKNKDFANTTANNRLAYIRGVPDLSTDEGAERFISAGHTPGVARCLVGLYHCARGPVDKGGRGLNITDAIEHALTTHLELTREAHGS